MTKQDNIFQLYDLLNKNGSKGDAIKFIANLIGIKKVSVKGNWFNNKEIPNYIKTEDLDAIVTYLQNAIKNQK